MVIGSIGIGLFILILAWIVALFVFVVGVKYQSNLSWIALGSATTLTAILAILPLESHSTINKEKEYLESDYIFVYRVIFLTFLVLVALVSVVFLFIFHCIAPIHPKSIKQFCST